jgi:hypothetical protein
LVVFLGGVVVVVVVVVYLASIIIYSSHEAEKNVACCYDTARRFQAHSWMVFIGLLSVTFLD